MILARQLCRQWLTSARTLDFVSHCDVLDNSSALSATPTVQQGVLPFSSVHETRDGFSTL
jgi:hypothetical protein